MKLREILRGILQNSLTQQSYQTLHPLYITHSRTVAVKLSLRTFDAPDRTKLGTNNTKVLVRTGSFAENRFNRKLPIVCDLRPRNEERRPKNEDNTRRASSKTSKGTFQFLVLLTSYICGIKGCIFGR